MRVTLDVAMYLFDTSHPSPELATPPVFTQPTGFYLKPSSDTGVLPIQGRAVFRRGGTLAYSESPA